MIDFDGGGEVAWKGHRCASPRVNNTLASHHTLISRPSLTVSFVVFARQMPSIGILESLSDRSTSSSPRGRYRLYCSCSNRNLSSSAVAKSRISEIGKTVTDESLSRDAPHRQPTQSKGNPRGGM